MVTNAFVSTLGIGVYHSIVGTHDGICILCDRPLVYGLEAFEKLMEFAIFLFWPVYIIAAVIIILAYKISNAKEKTE